MGWAAIIAALLEFLGPLVQEWIKKCTEERLEEAALDLTPVDSFGGAEAATAALLDAAIADLPRRAFVRRQALRRLKAATAQRFADGSVEVGPTTMKFTKPLTADELSEARDLCGAIRSE